MTTGYILSAFIVVLVLGGVVGSFGGFGYGFDRDGMGTVGIVLVVIAGFLVMTYI